MKWQRIVLVLLTAGIAQSSMRVIPPYNAADDQTEDTILQAYRAAPDVAAEIENYRRQGLVDRGARTMLVSRSCGVAGCSYEYLIAHLFSYGGTNPQDRAILARAHGITFGGPTVEVVKLTPKRRLPVSDGRPEPDRKFWVIETVPAPRPDRPVTPPGPNP